MNIPADLPLHLLHRNGLGTLATHARSPEGFPYPTVMPFALDARHRPVILVSGLAEHTRNLAADPRAGFLVVDEPDSVASGGAEPEGGVLNAARVTLVGRFERIDDDPSLTQRYLRYHPDAARYVALGDFSFWALVCQRMRYIGGFGQMGWLDADALDPLPPLSFDEEQALWAAADRPPLHRAGLALLGVDRYGADWRRDGRRVRTPFDAPKTDPAAVAAALQTVAPSLSLPTRT
ncbi:HugZ family pyridoxamine 5'-phosphate oxidase [Burkholderia alba]|uniref:HugZ family pyridoxamine 5'-phosphate oxidase n=1 Tax=Burkholderia alba TaxID=2683677 RepID=UPI002B057629|nr:pyridoxamine 5'-phosphate oxidase family protein [Burkholderia alba]